VAFLDHAGPRPDEALHALAADGWRAVTVVPLLLTAAYHGRVDVPAVAEGARAAGMPIAVTIADVLGPVSPPLVSGLIRRLPDPDVDAVVLAAAGTRDATARATVADAAAALGAQLRVPATVAYASAAAPTGAAAVSALCAAGAQRVGVAAYFLAPGRLYDVAMQSARSAGAAVVASPLGDAPELVRLIGFRVEAALSAGLARAA
jgi:sirohydrochlorin ferrochelatase